MRIIQTFLLALLLMFTSCAKVGTPPIHAGAANSFDSAVYDALVSAQAAIEQAKVGVSATKKPILNQVIADYNLVEKAYTEYHALAIAGNATPAQQIALQTKLTTLQAGLTKLGSTK